MFTCVRWQVTLCDPGWQVAAVALRWSFIKSSILFLTCVFNARSIHNKHTSISNWIADRRLSVACLVETWHDSHDCPDLVACAPTGYNYVDRSRPRTESTSNSLRTNHRCKKRFLCFFIKVKKTCFLCFLFFYVFYLFFDVFVLFNVVLCC